MLIYVFSNMLVSCAYLANILLNAILGKTNMK